MLLYLLQTRPHTSTKTTRFSVHGHVVLYVVSDLIPGAMAGLGVAMVIIGLCIGFGILFGIYKIRGGSFTNSFSPKTFTEKEME